MSFTATLLCTYAAGALKGVSFEKPLGFPLTPERGVHNEADAVAWLSMMYDGARMTAEDGSYAYQVTGWELREESVTP